MRLGEGTRGEVRGGESTSLQITQQLNDTTPSATPISPPQAVDPLVQAFVIFSIPIAPPIIPSANPQVPHRKQHTQSSGYLGPLVVAASCGGCEEPPLRFRRHPHALAEIC